MSSSFYSIFEFLRMIVMVVNPLIGCVVLAGALLLFTADRRGYTLCIVIGTSIFLLLQLAYIVMWFPNLGVLVRDNPDPDKVQKFFAYTSVVDVIGRILFGYGLLMLGIVHWKMSKNPDFRREPS